MGTNNVYQLLRPFLGLRFLLRDRILLESFEKMNEKIKFPS